MRKFITGLLAMAVAGIGFTRGAGASAVANMRFDVDATPNQPLSNMIFDYGAVNPATGGTAVNVLQLGNFPANAYSDNSNVANILGGIYNLAPTWTSFSLYSVTSPGVAPIYGIAVAINPSYYATAAGQSFDSLFGTNIDSALGTTLADPEATLVADFQANSVPMSFSTGISETPAADIPYGVAAPIVLYSNGTYGGSIEAFAVPEPASLGLIAAAAGLLFRRRR